MAYGLERIAAGISRSPRPRFQKEMAGKADGRVQHVGCPTVHRGTAQAGTVSIWRKAKLIDETQGTIPHIKAASREY